LRVVALKYSCRTRFETIGMDAIAPALREPWRHAPRGTVARADLEAMGPFVGPVKQPVRFRLDPDILH
jgi:hypothetical protein